MFGFCIKISLNEYKQAYCWSSGSWVESCRARFLAPRPRNAPFFLLPRPEPDQKIENIMVPTLDQPDFILPELDWTWPKQFIINLKLKSSDYNKHVSMPCNEVKTSYNMLSKDNNHSIYSVWEWKAYFSLRCKFVLKILGKISHTPVEKNPDPERHKIIKFPDPTDPKNIL